ncbi:gamma-glutamyltransferase [candidate division KSB1 bacterium]|nr:gamma-glutamyltransferase [bacterium]NUM68720.1 gamma-glutamyltransferase [candidate division KSB1 bacterium]
MAAGTAILKAGGNAADAAVATLLVLSVKHIGAFCIGGEVPLMIYDAKKREVKVLAGQGAAPKDSLAMAWYYKNGIPGDDMRAAAVPAVIDLCVTALSRYGTMSFEQVATPALALLEAGGPNWYRDTGSGDTLDGLSGKKIDIHLLSADTGGRSWYADLAKTLRKLGDAERNTTGTREAKLKAVADRFYRGDIADELVEWYIACGGFLRKRDLAEHVTRVEDPVMITYRDYTILKCDTWTQGPYLSQALRLLEGFDLKRMGFLTADYIHVVTEAMKLALADRDEYYGDPLFSEVPLKALLSDEYTKLRRQLIGMNQASRELRPGDPMNMQALLQRKPRTFPASGGTTTCVVVDRWGSVVAATPSGLSSTEGSGGSTGVTHGTRLVIFNTWPDHPNRIEPGKRPRTTLTPTLVLKNGKPVMAISVAGGDMQDQAALQLILDHVDFQMSLEEAMSAPRFSTDHFIGSFGQDKPRLGSLSLNQRIDEEVGKELERRGHTVKTTRSNIGGVAMLLIDPKSGMCQGQGAAAGGLE